MDGRVICMVFGISLFILIIYLIFSGGGDDDDAVKKPIIKPKENICKQIERTFNKEYLVENNLKQLRLNDNYTDIELATQNTVLHAHKIILASHSQYFDTAIWEQSDPHKNEANSSSSSSDDDSGTQRLSIGFIDHKTLMTVLSFMYGGTLSDDVFQNPDDYENLLRAATEFQMHSLICEISKRLDSRKNIHNVGSLFALATETNARFLRIVASNYLLDEFQQVSRTTEWQSVTKDHKDILAIAIDFHANLPNNTECSIQCAPSTLQSPAVVTRLRQFFLTQRFADAEIHVKLDRDSVTKVFHVNRATLTGQSVAFRQAFGDARKIEVEAVVPDVMEEFLVYMYSGWPTQKINEMPAGLLYLSAIYEMKGLQTTCEDILIKTLNEQNAADIVIVADKANSKRLFSIALDYILKHRQLVVKTKAWMNLIRYHPGILTKISLD